MEHVSISRSNARLQRIYFGDENSSDYITISPDSPILFDRFANGFKKIILLAESAAKTLEGIENDFPDTENTEESMDRVTKITKVNVQFSEEAVKIADDIFGSGTMDKYFSDIRLELPDFIPDSDCFLDFFEKITPVMENTFNKKLEDAEKLRKEKMAKYQPISQA